MVLVEAGAVDLVVGPAEDAEGVIGSEVDEGEADGAGAGSPGGAGGEEDVSDEIGVGGVGWGVDAQPVEMGRGIEP